MIGTEKTKMLAGKPYDAWDAELLNDRMRAKKLCTQFNRACPTDTAGRIELLRQLISFNDDIHMEPDFFCDYGYNIRIGSNFYSNHHLTILDICPVTIGDNCVIGAGSVVNKSIPANSVAVGNPCRVVRQINVNDHFSV